MSTWWLLAPAMFLLSVGFVAGGLTIYLLLGGSLNDFRRARPEPTRDDIAIARRRREALGAAAGRARLCSFYDQDDAS